MIEIMIVVSAISLLAALALPSFMKSRRTAQVTNVINDLRVFRDALNIYAMNKGKFPDDTEQAPAFPEGSGVEEYLNIDRWSRITALGGHYEWEGPNNHPYAGIALLGTTASIEQLTELDKKIDDGDLVTGQFRLTPSERYTFIIEE